MPSEFIVGAKYYQGTQSPNNAERKAKGYSSAWLHHKGRNKHHYEYWMDYSSHSGKGIIPAKMPEKYVIEMFIDRVAASKNYNNDSERASFRCALRSVFICRLHHQNASSDNIVRSGRCRTFDSVGMRKTLYRSSCTS